MKKATLSRVITLLLAFALVGTLAGCDVAGFVSGLTHTHTAAADDGDCTTAVVCTECNEVVVEAKAAHEAGEDDGDCTTAVACVNCTKIVVEAMAAHEAGEDDDNCLTAVKCVNCTKDAIAARTAHEAGEDDGNCLTEVICAHCKQVVVEARTEHEMAEDDDTFLTAVTCVHCAHVFVEAKPAIDLTISTVGSGSAATQKVAYAAGDVVVIGALPNQGFNLKSFVIKKNGEAMACTPVEKDGAYIYTFTAEDAVYTVEAEFAAPVFTVTKHNWDLTNQYNGSVTMLEKSKDGFAVTTTAKNYKEATIWVKDLTPSLNEDGSIKPGDFSAQISFIFDNGKKYEVRLHNTDAKSPNYKLQTMGGADNLPNTKWAWAADLTAEQKDRLMNGNGVKFSVKLNGGNAELWVDDSKMATIALGEEYAEKSAQVSICINGSNTGENIVLPFELAAEYSNPIFTVSKGYWDVSNQNNGSILVPNKGSSAVTVKTVANSYREVAVIVKDLNPTFGSDGKGNFKFEIDFDFSYIDDTGATKTKKLQVRIDNELANGVNGEYRVLNMGNNIITGWNPKYYVTTDMAAATKIRSEEGVEFRVKLDGANAVVSLDGNVLFTLDLSVGGITAESTAAITLLMEGNVGITNIEIPFTLG